jgi:broad specificity phosphatase PhoE
MIIYDVLRHAHAPRVEGIYANWKADSRYRSLNPEGVKQALRLHNQYNDEGAVIRLGLYSPAPRALCTLAIAVAGCNIPIVQLDELFTPENADGDILNPAFDKLGNELAGYLGDETLFKTLQRFGENAASAIRKKVAELLPGVENGVVVIANHAITGNFVAWALSNWKAREVCLSTSLGNADRLRVDGESVSPILLNRAVAV